MLEQIKIPLAENSPYYCNFRKIPLENRLHVTDPNIIEKVESSKKYLLTYEESADTATTDIQSIRSEMGSPNKDLCSTNIDETPYLVKLPDRMIPITIFRIPTKQKQKAIIFIHGGGFIGGSTNVLRNQCRYLAEQSLATVISVDYRLAPENPFPSGLNDCKEIVSWVVKHADDYNILADKVIISGESAGGNLAMAVSLSEIGKNIALTIPIYAALDLSMPKENNYWNYDKYEVISEHKKYVLTRLNRFANLNVLIREMYCSNNEDITSQEISPLYADNFCNLKKVVIIEAEYDFFRLSNDWMAQKLIDAGIPCEVIRYQGMDHGFYDRLGYCEQTRDCILEIAQQVKII